MRKGEFYRDPFTRIQKTESCWIWINKPNSGGYGIIYYKGSWHPAHRIIYMLLRGPIPEGLELDHLCKNRRCVNPDHLEPVTSRVNQRRGNGFAGINANKIFCKHGHLLLGDNLVKAPSRVRAGHRNCRACTLADCRNYRETHKEKRKEQWRNWYAINKDARNAQKKQRRAQLKLKGVRL